MDDEDVPKGKVTPEDANYYANILLVVVGIISLFFIIAILVTMAAAG